MASFLKKRVRPAGLLFVGSFLSMALLSLVAWLSRTPFVFPSLGPTAYLLLYSRRAPQSTPRRALVGHAVGILCGYAALLISGLASSPSALGEGLGAPRMMATALSLAGTGAGMVLLDAFHPPAGATTLIVSLGIIRRPLHLFIIEVAVAVLVAMARTIDALEEKFPLG